MYIKRHLEEQIRNASQYYPVVMVCGQRQVGKSTMLNHIREPERRYVTLDDGNARRLASTDPALFFETYGYPLLIDEFQRVPSILLEMKKIVDQKALDGEDNNGMFWLTGSQKFKMMQDVAESLAGRIAIFDMASLSTAEIEDRPADLFHPDLKTIRERLKHCKRKNIHEVYEDIFRGGMPKLRTTDLDRDRFYMDYINTYIERDIKDLAQVGKLNEFYDFLVYMAARTGQELKYDEIASTIGVSAPTAKSWVSILERSGIIFILRPYYSNITKRLVKTPKVYFMDTGLAAYLALEIVFIAYASTRSAVNHSTQHIEHLVGTLLTDHLVHARLEMGNDIDLIVLDLCDEHRCTADAVVDEGGICTHHLAHRNLARTEAQGHRGMYVGILYTIIIEQINKLLR